MTEQERAAMQQALEALEEVDGFITALLGSLLGSPAEDAPGTKVRASINALKAALAQEQEQKQKLLEAVRVRIMSTAYDCADDGEVEAYNSVKVLCTELLEMLK